MALLAACQGQPTTVAPRLPPEIVCGPDVPVVGEVRMPRNIVMVMGDGMGPVHLQAGRILRGGPLRMDALDGPVYLNTDSLTTDAADDPASAPATDSAASATAFATGHRVGNGVISLEPDGAPLQTVAELAAAAGKSVGLVTTSSLYDASPAAQVAHAASRYDAETILMQMLADATPQVLLGGGRPQFFADGGQFLAVAQAQGYQLVGTAAQLAAWQPSDRPLLGLFQGSAVSEQPALWEWFTTPELLRDSTSSDPTLPEMTDRALDGLIGDPDGFLLFVENEHTDTLGHISLVARDLALAALPHEVVAIDDAVGVVVDRLAAEGLEGDTLVLVLADHETGGYTLYGEDPLDAAFWTSGHTRTPVAVYAQGPGAGRLSSLCRIADLHLLMTGRLP